MTTLQQEAANAVALLGRIKQDIERVADAKILTAITRQINALSKAISMPV